jgi:dihydrofolate synthase / folylpolyglutamate synthase
MDYKQTLDYLYSQLPMFTRVGAVAIKKDLTNTIALCNALNNPQTKFKTIHVAGTNGKGSVSHILASVLQSAGYKTGLYTSPHLKDFRERIKINGEMIPQQFVVDFVAENKNLFSTISPSFFEMTVALCFDYFAKEGVEIAVIETGLGGRLDSTNIINPQLSVITNIGWDHMDMLGDTLELIAGEKAGIIKPNTPVVIGETQQETKQVFIDKAQALQAPIVFADGEYSLTNFDNTGTLSVCDVYKGKKTLLLQLQCELTGIYQQKNIITAIAATEQLQQAGYKISEAHIRQGFAQVKNQTGLLGRWQKLSDIPLTYADTGHNLNGVQEVLKQLQLLHYNQLHIVWGMVKDKDISKILALLPTTATYYFCNAQIPRALAAEDLQLQANTFSLKGEVYPTVELAVQAAQKAANTNDLVFVGGSTFVVAEAV